MFLTFRTLKLHSKRASLSTLLVFARQLMPRTSENRATRRSVSAVVTVSTSLLISLSTASVGLPSQAIAADPGPSSIRLNRCLDEIDQVTRHYVFADPETSEQQFKELQYSCSHVPQLHHNLGVIAAQKQEWKEAIAYFEQSLALDQRAAMTQQSLASIYQFKASLAYKKALNLSEKIKLPVLSMQTSALTNLCKADSVQPQPDVIIPASMAVEAASPILTKMNAPSLPETQVSKEQLQEAVLYDVNSWWTAILEQDDEALPAHYVDAADNKIAPDQQEKFAWNELIVDVEFVDRIALVSITYPTAVPANVERAAIPSENRDVLLVMKEENNMWKIVREEQI